MEQSTLDLSKTGLLIVDLQNDFIHPDGAYARGKQSSEMIAVLPNRVLPVANALRQAGGWVVSTQFTLLTANYSTMAYIERWLYSCFQAGTLLCNKRLASLICHWKALSAYWVNAVLMQSITLPMN